VVGRPAILIPLPTATDDHQSRNAAELVRAGAAVLAPERTTSAAELAALISALLGDPARRAGMSRAIAALGRPGAARDIVDELERLVAEAAA
jgi:UDP-N-acetylglucosamine--N-acetylmuramyl-(pentapeptide) pyrophosphoryl-undecaprenol N-acetylglucosamine transferase